MNRVDSVVAQMTKRDQARFWSKVAISDPDACWPWKSSPNKIGTCQTKWKGVYIGPHVLAFALSGGSFESGPLVRHVVCRNPRCCNPRHLASGTHQDNADDRERDGMTARGPLNGARKVAKLTEEDVRNIRFKYENSAATQREMAEEHGVSSQLISKIICGQRWTIVE